MVLSLFSRKLSILLFLMGIYNSLFADALYEFNMGTEVAATIEKNGGRIQHDGDAYAMKKYSIQADTYAGAGYVEAPTVIIRVKKFDFSGTIKCSGTCIIHAEEPFNETMFKREGNGKFVVSTGSNAPAPQKIEEPFSIEPLKNAFVQYPSRNPKKIIAGIGIIGAYAIYKAVGVFYKK